MFWEFPIVKGSQKNRISSSANLFLLNLRVFIGASLKTYHNKNILENNAVVKQTHKKRAWRYQVITKRKYLREQVWKIKFKKIC